MTAAAHGPRRVVGEYPLDARIGGVDVGDDALADGCVLTDEQAEHARVPVLAVFAQVRDPVFADLL